MTGNTRGSVWYRRHALGITSQPASLPATLALTGDSSDIYGTTNEPADLGAGHPGFGLDAGARAAGSLRSAGRLCSRRQI